MNARHDCSQTQEEIIMRIVEKLEAVRFAEIYFKSKELTVENGCGHRCRSFDRF